MSTDTSHEARARNAKAQALAAVLLEHGATVANVAELPAAGWSMVAELATIQTGRKVHAPHSQATIAAVARILGDLIAHRDEQDAIAERDAVTPEPVDPADMAGADEIFASIEAYSLPPSMRSKPDRTDVMTADLDADTPDAWCDDDDRAEAARPHADTYERPPVRTARASQGYRAYLARIAPQPETTEADLFGSFKQAVNR